MRKDWVRQGSGFRVQGSGFRVQGKGLGFRVQGLGFGEFWGFGILGFRSIGCGFHCRDLGRYRVQGL